MLALTILLLPGLKETIPPEPANPVGLAVMVGAEILAGGTLGWLARLAVLALPMAGHIVSHMLGLSNVLQPDPEMGAQSSMLQHAFGVAAVVLVMTSGLYALPLLALAGSYGVFPPGGAGFAADGASTMVQAVAASFARDSIRSRR